MRPLVACPLQTLGIAELTKKENDLVTDHEAVRNAKDFVAISVVPRHEECRSMFPMDPFDDETERYRKEMYNKFLAEL